MVELTPTRQVGPIEQVLFGYDDGHRVLVSSGQIASEIARDLVMLSDLVPGAILDDGGSYWTGVPLRQHRSYALMQTWLAPEMPRPGCVWTQALIIRGADLARFEDLASLMALFQRPTVGNFGVYSLPILVEPRDLPVRPKLIDPGMAALVLSAVYGHDKVQAVPALPGEVDETTFALWSQQWPRLQRSFSFRTAVTRSESRGELVKFDLKLRLPSSGESRFISGVGEPWLSAAALDLVEPTRSPFRRFLARYGSDLRRGRPQFRLLAEVYARTRYEYFSEIEIEDLIDLLSSNLPDPSEGRALKEEIFSSTSDLLPRADHIAVLKVSLKKGSLSLANWGESLGVSLRTVWPERADEIFTLAEEALEQPSDVGNQVLSLVSSLVGEDEVLRATARHPRLRAKLVASMPQILDTVDLASLQTREIVDLLDAVHLPPDRERSVLSRCLSIDDYWLSNRLVSMFGEKLLATIFEVATRKGNSAVSISFRNVFRSNIDSPFRIYLLSQITMLSEGWRAAHLMGWDSYTVVRQGAAIWAEVLDNSEDDLEVSERLDFFAFLFVVALANCEDGVEGIIAATYLPLLKAAEEKCLSELACDTLKRHLPYLGYNGGSIERRLSSAVARSYVNGHLDITTFSALLMTKKSMDALVREIEGLFGGGRFLQHVVTLDRDPPSKKKRRKGKQ